MTIIQNKLLKNNIDYFSISDEISNILVKNLSKSKNRSFNSLAAREEIEIFLDTNLEKLLPITFEKKIVIYYEEVINTDMLEILHNYFSNRCCNIRNVLLITQTSGLEIFYRDFCKLYCDVGMTIIEIPFAFNYSEYYYQDSQIKDFNKKISKLFCYYGGGKGKIILPEHTFMALFMSQFSSVSTIESIERVSKQSDLEGWLEKKTFFLNAVFVEKFADLYKKYVDEKQYLDKSLISVNTMHKNPAANGPRGEKFGSGDYQEIVDSQCMICVCRETLIFDMFQYISEKTFRCFYNHLIPMPISGKNVIEDLSSCGFYMFEDLIDFSYLQEDLFPNLIVKLETELRRLSEIPLEEYQDYYNRNIDKFQHNQQLVLDWSKTVENRVEEMLRKNDLIS